MPAKPPKLTPEQQAKVEAALKASAKGLIERLGDKMENSKRPVIRAVARFFRGK